MLSIEEKKAVLASSSIFASLPDSVIKRVAGRAGQIDFAAGEVLCRDGEPGNSVYLVASGELEVLKGSVVLAVISRGDMVGEMAVLTGDVRNATVRARTGGTVLFLKAKALKLLIQQMPDVAFGIFGLLAGRLRKADDYILSLVEKRPAIASLEVISGPDAGRQFDMVSDRMEIGRITGSVVEDQARCALNPPENLSAEHGGEIVHSGGSFFLQPAVPDEPVLLNGEEVEGSVELSDGDMITAVGTDIRFLRKEVGHGN